MSLNPHSIRSGVRPVIRWWGPLAIAAYLLTPVIDSPLRRDEALAWLGLTAVVVAARFAFLLAVGRPRSPLRPVELMAAQVLAISVVTDLAVWGGPLRDLHLYLRAGNHWLAGSQPYTLTAITRYPAGDQLPFLYPPPLLPVLGVLSALPGWLADSLWVGASIVAVVVALRLIGLPRRWAVLALVWTPVEQAIFVGNIVAPSLLLLALAPRLRSLPVLGPLAKPQNSVVALWLLRERAWRALAAGVAGLGVIVLVTLPLTGLQAWSDWLRALSAYQESQIYLPGLYGIGLGRHLPAWLFAAVALAVVGLALLASRKEGLARLGLASVVASPSLWNHGYLWALPALLSLRSEALWLAAAVMCHGGWPGPQLVLAMGVAAWFVPALRRSAASAQRNEDLHPLGMACEPWPQWPDERSTPPSTPTPSTPTRPAPADPADPAPADAGLD